MELKVYKRDGSEAGETISFPDEIFSAEPNTHSIYLSVVSEETARRQGTHATLNRSLVRGGGKKPWKQKGRGVARAGTNRSPLWRGGGRIFGPQPRYYYKDVNKKVKKLARRSAYSIRLNEEAIRVVEDFTLEAPKTKDMVAFAAAQGITNKKILFLTQTLDRNLYLSSRNIYKFRTMPVRTPSVRDIINSEVVVVMKSAVDELIQGVQ